MGRGRVLACKRPMTSPRSVTGANTSHDPTPSSPVRLGLARGPAPPEYAGHARPARRRTAPRWRTPRSPGVRRERSECRCPPRRPCEADVARRTRARPERSAIREETRVAPSASPAPGDSLHGVDRRCRLGGRQHGARSPGSRCVSSAEHRRARVPGQSVAPALPSNDEAARRTLAVASRRRASRRSGPAQPCARQVPKRRVRYGLSAAVLPAHVVLLLRTLGVEHHRHRLRWSHRAAFEASPVSASQARAPSPTGSSSTGCRTLSKPSGW